MSHEGLAIVQLSSEMEVGGVVAEEEEVKTMAALEEQVIKYLPLCSSQPSQ